MGKKTYCRRSAQGDFGGNPPSPNFGVACGTAAIVNLSPQAGELASFCSRVPALTVPIMARPADDAAAAAWVSAYV